MTDVEWYHHVFSDVFTFADEMNLDLTWQQREVLQAVDDGHSKITVRSGQGVGKTVCSIIPALFRLGKYYESKVIVTAPTMKQAKDVWLGEVRKKIKLASPRLQRFFKVTKTKVVVDNNDEWALELRTSTSPESAQGDHSENMTVIVEEASGVDRALIHQYLGTLSNPNSFLLLIGNPNCVCAGMDVYDPGKGRVAVEDYVQGRVAAMREKDLTIYSKGARGIYSGKKDCLRLVLASGQTLECSTDHPIYTEKGWKRADEVGDLLVATPASLPKPARYSKYEDDVVKFCAFMMTDGCTTLQGTTPRCSFTQMPGDVLDEFLGLSMVAGRYIERQDSENTKRIDVRGASDLIRALEQAGGKSTTKRVPSDFFLLPDRQLGLFLNRLWACDGSFNRYGPKICLANRKFLEDIRTLLLRFGIHSRVWYTQVKNEKTFAHLNGRTFDAWTLAVTEADSVALWKEHVGEVLGKEGKCIDPSGTNPNSDVVPITNVELGEILDELGLPDGRYGKRVGGGKGSGKGGGGSSTGTERTRLRKKYTRVGRMSSATFRELVEETGYQGKHFKFADSGVRWEKVKSCENTGTQEVYDLTVPGAGNFVCENVVVHNTRSSYFFDTFNRLRDDWHCIHIDAEKTPISSWFGATRNADIAREFGIDSDVYRVRVKGDFPSVDPDSVMGSEELERCTGPDRLMAAIREGRSSGFRRAIGYDFARFGSDESVIAVRNGYALTSLESFAKVDPSRVIAKGFARQKELAWADRDVQHIFDAGGMGQGLAHIFYDAGKECLEFNFGGKPMDSAYGNLITEAYFLFAKMIRKKTVYIPNDPTLIRQLSNRKYMVNNKGKIVLEEKSVFKRRNQDEEGNGDSPDRADACVMAFYDASQYEVQVG